MRSVRAPAGPSGCWKSRKVAVGQLWQVSPLTLVICWGTPAPELSLSGLSLGRWPAQRTTVCVIWGQSWPVPACCL